MIRIVLYRYWQLLQSISLGGSLRSLVSVRQFKIFRISFNQQQQRRSRFGSRPVRNKLSYPPRGVNCSPLILIPGVGGSELRYKGSIGLSVSLWLLGSRHDLSLAPAIAEGKDVYAPDILREIAGKSWLEREETYAELIEFLTEQGGYRANQDIFNLPYLAQMQVALPCQRRTNQRSLFSPMIGAGH